MARVLDELPCGYFGNWSKFIDGKVYALTIGEDVGGKSVRHVQTNAHIIARRNGMKCKTRRISETEIAVQFTKKS